MNKAVGLWYNKARKSIYNNKYLLASIIYSYWDITKTLL